LLDNRQKTRIERSIVILSDVMIELLSRMEAV
jgi:hypothetical protein